MELDDLTELREKIEEKLGGALPDHSRKAVVSHPESPNPVCFFEVDGNCFAQGSFWANNEFRIHAMNTIDPSEIMNESGSVNGIEEALGLVDRFCEIAQGAG